MWRPIGAPVKCTFQCKLITVNALLLILGWFWIHHSLHEMGTAEGGHNGQGYANSSHDILRHGNTAVESARLLSNASLTSIILVSTNYEDGYYMSTVGKRRFFKTFLSSENVVNVHTRKFGTTVTNASAMVEYKRHRGTVVPHFPALSVHTPSFPFWRRNLEYARAILLGAEAIWDNYGQTQPDRNCLLFYTGENMAALQKISSQTIYSHTSATANPYVLFGATKATYSKKSSYAANNLPRGSPTPADVIKPAIPTLYQTELLRLSAALWKHYATGIVQVLAQQEPDIDQIVDLDMAPTAFTFKSRLSKVNIHPTQFMQVNSLSTVFFRPTFWLAYLPVTVSERLSDIWRGYIAQTLMRCTGHLVLVHKPVLRQTRYPENTALESVGDERASTDQLLSLLDTFKCDEEAFTPQACLIKLYKKLHKREFVGQKDVQGVQTWLQTLQALDYKFPSFKTMLCSPNEKGLEGMFLIQPPLLPKKAISDPQFLDRTLTVVQINHQHVDVIPVWLSLYQHLVSDHVVFYAYGVKPCSSLATDRLLCNITSRHQGWTVAYANVLDALERFPQYEIYMVTNDDAMFNPNIPRWASELNMSLAVEPDERIHFHINEKGRVSTGGDDIQWYWESASLKSLSSLANDGAIRHLRPLLTKYCPDGDTEPRHRPYAYDVYVLNRRDKEMFAKIAQIFQEHELFLEVAVPWIMHCALGATQDRDLTLKYMSGNDVTHSTEVAWDSSYCVGVRASKDDESTALQQVQVIHPVKLTFGDSNWDFALALRHCFLSRHEDFEDAGSTDYR